jgi:Cu-Zn family superoxide dismutase
MNKVFGICVFNDTINGTIEFEESKNNVTINVSLKGVPSGKHAIHIHESGDLTDGCNSACAHFNPYNKKHGGPDDKERHVGDLGNIVANKLGIVKTTFTDKKIKLRGKCSIIGRSVIIHDKEDDLGKGGLDNTFSNVIDAKKRNESLITGNAGKRIACGVIGYSKKCK